MAEGGKGHETGGKGTQGVEKEKDWARVGRAGHKMGNIEAKTVSGHSELE